MLGMVSTEASPAAGCTYRNRSRSALLALAVLLSFYPVGAHAQTGGQAAITGTVQDSSGAVVPNATVTAHSEETGVDVTRTSSSAGLYEISPLNVGAYTVKASAKGFQQFQQQKIVLNQGQTLGLNIVLKIGTASETVTVTSAPPQ